MRSFIQMKGFVLITTILMLFIISSLVLSIQSLIFTYTKAVNQLVIKTQAYYKLDSFTHKILAYFDRYLSESCIYKNLDMDAISYNMLLKNGCRGPEEDYYLISDLGRFPCMQIDFAKNPYTSHHWLLNTASPDLPNKIMQIRVALISDLSNCKIEQARKINQGMVSTVFRNS